jgi:hypothetical protein
VDALKTHFRIELDAPYEQLRPLPKKGLDDGYVVQPNKNSGSVDEEEISGGRRGGLYRLGLPGGNLSGLLIGGLLGSIG